MENKCWKTRERDGTHTFRRVAMCKWQMDDPEARVKSSLSHMVGRFEYGFVIKALENL
jgi:hypothetical protein